MRDVARRGLAEDGGNDLGDAMRVLRFLLILPAAIVAGVTVLFPIHWSAVLLMHENGFLRFMAPETLERLLCSAIVPAAFVTAGAFTAPGYRFRISLVLAALIIVGVIVGALTVSGSEDLAFNDPPALLALKAALVLAGLSFGVFRAWRAEHPV